MTSTNFIIFQLSSTETATRFTGEKFLPHHQVVTPQKVQKFQRVLNRAPLKNDPL